MKIVMALSALFVLQSCGDKQTEDSKEGGIEEASKKEIEIEKETDNMLGMNLYDFKIEDINGEAFDLSTLKGKKVLLVNTASECGLTPQYELLQDLYDSLGGDNFTIVGFPANNFGSQEPGSNKEIAGFCQKNYGVTFPMMSKISVKGDDAHPIYKWLIEQEKAASNEPDFEPAWNFHKFLINEEGNYVRQLSPQTLPTDESLISWIQE